MATAAAAQQQHPPHFEEMRSQTEELLRRQGPTKWDIVEVVAITCTGALFLQQVVLDHSQSKPDRIALWILVGFCFLLGGAYLCRILRMRRKLKRTLAEMHSALDLESAGELRTSPCTAACFC